MRGVFQHLPHLQTLILTAEESLAEIFTDINKSKKRPAGAETSI
jgi:hypothetical protein